MAELRWTKEVPTVPGWYWWRKREGKVPLVVELEESETGGDYLVRTDLNERVFSYSGEWAGPLQEPLEAV